MRIVVTADLHYRPAARSAYAAFAGWVETQTPDCLIVAGDVGHPLRLFERGLQLFANLPCPRLVIAGNHDVYRTVHHTAPRTADAKADAAAEAGRPAAEPPVIGSRALWEELLPAVAAAEGFAWLESQSVRLGSTGICGTLGWYDYSARSPHLPFTDADYPHLKKLINHDADYIDWPWSDRAMARYLGKGFAARLQTLEDDPLVQRIVVVTHMPIFCEALPTYPQNEMYSLQRAYLGNFTLGELVRRAAKVTHVVSGHLHRAGQWQVAGAHGPIDCRVVGSQPGKPGAVVLEVPD